MEIKRVKLASIKVASFNPEERSDPQGKDLGKLQKSIETHGLFYPVLVDKKNNLIDGHRRLTAASNLGWEEIPAIVVEGDADHAEIYANVNYTAKYLSGNETLRVWLKNPMAVSPASARTLARYEEMVGRPLIERIAKAGMATKALGQAVSIASYVDRAGDVRFIRKTVSWLIKHRGSKLVTAYMRLQQSPAALYKAIESGKELKPVFRSK